jgi:hypothetical protein
LIIALRKVLYVALPAPLNEAERVYRSRVIDDWNLCATPQLETSPNHNDGGEGMPNP